MVRRQNELSMRDSHWIIIKNRRLILCRDLLIVVVCVVLIRVFLHDMLIGNIHRAQAQNAYLDIVGCR